MIAEYRGFQYITALISRQIKASPRFGSVVMLQYPLEIHLKYEEGEESGEMVIQPDVALFFEENFPGEFSSEGEKRVEAVPDLLIEIQSPGCGSENINRRMEFYWKAGIKEHWLIFPLDRVIVARRRGEDGVFKKPEVYSEADMISLAILPEITVDLYPVFNPSLSDRLINSV